MTAEEGKQRPMLARGIALVCYLVAIAGTGAFGVFVLALGLGLEVPRLSLAPARPRRSRLARPIRPSAQRHGPARVQASLAPPETGAIPCTPPSPASSSWRLPFRLAADPLRRRYLPPPGRRICRRAPHRGGVSGGSSTPGTTTRGCSACARRGRSRRRSGWRPTGRTASSGIRSWRACWCSCGRSRR